MSNNLESTIDALGILKAQKAELTAREDELKASLGDLKPGAYEGKLFRLTISETKRDTIDMDAVREKLSPQWIRAHTRTSDVRTLRVVARSGKDVVAA